MAIASPEQEPPCLGSSPHPADLAEAERWEEESVMMLWKTIISHP